MYQENGINIDADNNKKLTNFKFTAVGNKIKSVILSKTRKFLQFGNNSESFNKYYRCASISKIINILNIRGKVKYTGWLYP